MAATILEELVGSMEAAFETAAIELAKVGAGDDAYAMAQRIVAGAAKRKDVMLKAVCLLSGCSCFNRLCRKGEGAFLRYNGSHSE